MVEQDTGKDRVPLFESRHDYPGGGVEAKLNLPSAVLGETKQNFC